MVQHLVAVAPGNVRVRALRESLAWEAPEGCPEAVPATLWRRWFEGRAEWQEGRSVAAADMAVVVLGFRSQSSLYKAVESLLEQSDAAEIVVVNSGGGDVRRLLSPYSAQLRIINIEQPLFVGGARNIGIDASQAPYVAFLAGDCEARPDWVRTRMELHRRGSRAVASAMVPTDSGDLAFAAHLALFGARSPEVPPTQALRYGASYERQVFREFGYFDPGLRVQEDTDFLIRTSRKVHPAWNPRVQTAHGSPIGLWRFILDMYRRGKRLGFQRKSGAKRSLQKSSTVRGIWAAALRRTDIAEKIARNMIRLDEHRIAGIRRKLLLATLAYEIGTVVALLRSTKLRAASSDRTTFAGFQPEQMKLLADRMLRQGNHDGAWLVGERATINLPCEPSIHRQLAQAADMLGDTASFELAALDALARDPDAEDIWARFQDVFARRR